MEVQKATVRDIEKLIPALRELRPHRTEQELREMLPPLFEQGYEIAYIGDNTVAFAIAGFRILDFLFSGRTLYLDDLITHPDHRKNGYAGKLLEWLKHFAKQNDIDHFSLDSGFQRKDAYRLYLNSGLEVEALHFGRKVQDL